jgi:hypothetical protein
MIETSLVQLFFFRQKLTIYKLHPDDSGKYFCRVNDVETSAWLEVTRKSLFKSCIRI